MLTLICLMFLINVLPMLRGNLNILFISFVSIFINSFTGEKQECFLAPSIYEKNITNILISDCPHSLLIVNV